MKPVLPFCQEHDCFDECGGSSYVRQLAELLARCLAIDPERQATFLNAARGVRRVGRLGAPTRRATPQAPPPTLGRLSAHDSEETFPEFTLPGQSPDHPPARADGLA